MEQVPHWLAAAVFAAGMTAYAEEVDPKSHEIKAGEPDSAAPAGPRGPAFH